ncbi:MAG: uracil-DNA glycosylase, partial [Myxococcota bacterium]
LVDLLVGGLRRQKSGHQVTASLFVKYPNPQAFADADVKELEQDLVGVSFHRKKAKTLKKLNQDLVRLFGGKVPKDIKQLTRLGGVARKSANVVLNCCFDIPSGVIVDAHVKRNAPRMGMSTQTRPEKIERDLMKIVPKEHWTHFGPAMIIHGRYHCTARKPSCSDCIFLDLCPREGVSGARPSLPSNFPYKEGWRSGAPAQAASSLTSGAKATSQGGAAGGIDLWVEHLAAEMDKSYFNKLLHFVDQERSAHEVFPPEDEVFAAFSMTPLEEVKVVLLGQDPYHDNNQAHGLCFSVRPDIKIPPSLRNMYKELQSDLSITPPKHGYLAGWARQGVLMLNTVLTVRAHNANSHQKKGWETFTDEVIKLISRERDHVVFILWGGAAKKKSKLIDKRKHTLLIGTHPSPLSASRGFFGSKPYSTVNAALRKAGQPEIDWSQLPTS